MTRYELYIHACKFAVGEMNKRGSIAFSIPTGDEVTWDDVMKWLNDEQERAEWLKRM
ncbi:MAG: hypothetical protein IIZ78_01355 [Clostridiales bacterium]|nr:hypothetical protein [Clostridiales bacterium]